MDQKKLSDSDSLSFILNEYNECCRQKRHFAGVVNDLQRLMFLFYPGIIIVIFGLYKLFSPPDEATLVVLLAVTGASFLLGLLFLMLAGSNRAYMVTEIRKANSLKRRLAAASSLEFSEMDAIIEITEDPEYYDPNSTHTFLMWLVYLANSFLFAMITFLCVDLAFEQLPAFWAVAPLLTFLLAIIVQPMLSVKYMKSKAEEEKLATE